MQASATIRTHSIRTLVLALFCMAGSVLPANADWREEIGVFRIGLVASGDNVATRERAEPFQRAVSGALDMDVEFFISTEVSGVLDALQNDRIEYAVLPVTAYSLVNSICRCVEPLAVPRAADSSDSYYLVAVGRRGDGLSAKSLSGKRVGRLSGGSIASEELLRYLFYRDNPQADWSAMLHQPAKPSSEMEDAFIAGEYDVLFGWSSLNGEPAKGFSRGTLTRLVEKSRDTGKAYDVLWKSPPIPHRLHVVRKKINGEAKNLLRDLLTGLYQRDPVAYDSIEPVFSGGFSAARASSLKPFDEFFERLGEKKKGTTNAPSPSVETSN